MEAKSYPQIISILNIHTCILDFNMNVWHTILQMEMKISQDDETVNCEF